MSWDKLRIEGRLNFQFLKKSVRSVEGSKKIEFRHQPQTSISPHLFGEVEENGELPAAWQLGARLAQFVEECVRARLTLNFQYLQLFVAMI